MKITTIELQEKWDYFIENSDNESSFKKIMVSFQNWLKDKGIDEMSKEELEKNQNDFMEDYENSSDMNMSVWSKTYSTFQSTEWLDTVYKWIDADKKYKKKLEKIDKKSHKELLDFLNKSNKNDSEIDIDGKSPEEIKEILDKISKEGGKIVQVGECNSTKIENHKGFIKNFGGFVDNKIGKKKNKKIKKYNEIKNK